MSSARPQVFGSYVLLRKLGEGGMGTVYCAEDRRTPGQLVAVKLISDPSLGSGGDEPTLRFLRESKILESLRHPNIVTLFETGVVLGERYVAMELLKGRTLAAFVGRPWPRTVPLLLQVCHGMEYLASKGIVHRDLSPENVFVVADGARQTAKILDFGIAKDTTAQETIHDFTRTGVLMGKPPYWSPEQIELESGETLDWRSDLYTLGVIFFRVLSGELPFRAESPVEYIPLHLFRPPPELVAPEGRPPLPPALAAIVRRMLAKQKEDRPGSYGEVIGVLEEALGAAPEVLEADDAEEAAGPVRTKPTAPWETEATRALEGRTRSDEPTPTVAMGMPSVGMDTAPTVVTSRPSAGGPRRFLPVAIGASAAAALVAGLVALWPRGAPAPAPPVSPAAVAASPAPAAGAPPSSLEQTRTAPGTELTSETARAAEPAPAAVEGTLALDAIPWGRLVGLSDTSTGKAIPLPADPVTPLRLGLPPGRYRVDVARDAAAARVSLVVTVAAGVTRTLVVPLAGEADAAALLD